MTPADHLEKLLHDHPASPFLFVGSGFSQRYLGVPTWDGILRSTTKNLATPFEFYLASSDSKLPRCASLLSKDFGEYWWKADELAEIREKYREHIKGSSSPLKIAIADRLRGEFRLIKDSRLTEELEAFRALNAEGIITTNWDCLLESLFPGYKVYIGQQSVVRQTPQNIAEIYKIHGCCTDPNSLVLTEEDYALFRERQAYLAAKLITIFVEHPVVFLGYSVSDPNIIDLLKAILRGLGTDEIRKLQQNLIFLQRSKPGRPEGVKDTLLVVEDTQLPVTNLVTDDFLAVYTALSKSKLKLPARVLRFCKEQLYEIVASKEPSEKLCLLNLDDVENHKDLEFVVGIGVVGQQLSERGYVGVSPREIFGSVIFDEPRLDSNSVLGQVIPELDGGSNFLPVFKFLAEGNTDVSECRSCQRLIQAVKKGYKTPSYLKAAMHAISGKSFADLVNELPPEKAAIFIPYLAHDKIPVDELGKFCQVHFEKAFERGPSTNFRKLFCLYDYLRYGRK